jgi:6-phosphogluconolactonase
MDTKSKPFAHVVGILGLLLTLGSCGGGGSGGGGPVVLHGTISGLTGRGLVLQITSLGVSNNVNVAAGSTSFSFPTALSVGAPYTVSVLTPPISPLEVCVVNNGTGTAGVAPTNVSLRCANQVGRLIVVTGSGHAPGTLTYAIDPTTGALVQSVSGEAAFGPIAVARSGGFAFLAENAFGLPFVAAFTIDATTGALTKIGSSSPCDYNVSVGSTTIAIDPSSKFLFAANSDSSGSVCTIDPTTGALSPLVGGSFAAGKAASSVAVDASGRYVYVANSGSNNVTAFAINTTTGALTAIGGGPVAAGTGPSSVTVDPSGSYVYVANSGSNDVTAYAINTTTGALTPIAGGPAAAGTGPSSITVDPSGRYVYVTNSGSNDVTAYAINTTTGALTPVAGNPFTAGTGPFSAAVDPSGTYVYVANSGSSNITVYAMNTMTGGLIPVSITGSPFPSPSGFAFPVAIAIAPVP